MAVEGLDPKTLSSWEHAFQYPIAAVWGMERQLRNDINSNREKLRTLVGVSYRDLLGTAESITEMDGQMHRVESYLGAMGTECNSGLLERKAVNIRDWDDRERYAFATQLAVLRSCPEVISRLISGSYVLAASKLLVISRLLHKKLSKNRSASSFIEVLRNRLSALRHKLLTKINLKLLNVDAQEDTLLEAMCAFSLATSSSPTDVLRHFHQTRSEAIFEAGQSSGEPKAIFKALRLFVMTLKETQALFPTQLARSLEGLKNLPLLKSSDLSSILELNLDVHERWIEDDIKTFVPYVRHDDLQKAEAGRVLKQWAKQTFAIFLNHVQEKTAMIDDPITLVHLRQEMIELWFSHHQHAIGIDSSDVLDGLRDAFNKRFVRLIHEETVSLRAVGISIEKALSDPQLGIVDANQSFWDKPNISVNTTSNAKVLREIFTSGVYGKTQLMQTIYEKYWSWVDGVQKWEHIIKSLRETKWTDEIDDLEDEDDVLENKQIILCEDDPRLLQDELQIGIQEALNALQELLTKNVQLLHEKDGGQKATFLFRTWREIRRRLPALYRSPETALEPIQVLQRILATAVTARSVTQCEKRIANLVRCRSLPAKSLWEGSPPLPVLPSSWAFRLLYEVMSSMNTTGSDIWSPQAVALLKRVLCEQLVPFLGKLPEPQPEAELQTNGHDENTIGGEGDDKGLHGQVGNTNDVGTEQPNGEITQIPNRELSTIDSPQISFEDLIKDVATQRFFDVIYLQKALMDNNKEDTQEQTFEVVRKSVKDRAGLSLEVVNCIYKKAEDYWKRTSLLFALLA
ncbi:MAG: hypothetical protein Q9190_003407 [Brigantiaea leucoxantha]